MQPVRAAESVQCPTVTPGISTFTPRKLPAFAFAEPPKGKQVAFFRFVVAFSDISCIFTSTGQQLTGGQNVANYWRDKRRIFPVPC